MKNKTVHQNSTDLQEFMDGRLIVEVNDANDYVLFMNQLNAAGFDNAATSPIRIKHYNENYPYYFMRPSLTHNNLMVMEHASNREYIRKEYGIIKWVSFHDMDMSVKPELDYKVLYEQTKAERDIAFKQLRELGTSFGEKTDIARERIEGNAFHHLNSLLDRKKDDIVFKMFRAKTPRETAAILVDEVKNTSYETAAWLKQEQQLENKVLSFKDADAMYQHLKEGNDLYDMNTGEYAYLYNEDNSICVFKLDKEDADKIAYNAAIEGDYWSTYLGAGGTIFDKTCCVSRESVLSYCEDHYKDQWINAEDYGRIITARGADAIMQGNTFDDIER